MERFPCHLDPGRFVSLEERHADITHERGGLGDYRP